MLPSALERKDSPMHCSWLMLGKVCCFAADILSYLSLGTQVWRALTSEPADFCPKAFSPTDPTSHGTGGIATHVPPWEHPSGAWISTGKSCPSFPQTRLRVKGPHSCLHPS